MSFARLIKTFGNAKVQQVLRDVFGTTLLKADDALVPQVEDVLTSSVVKTPSFHSTSRYTRPPDPGAVATMELYDSMPQEARELFLELNPQNVDIYPSDVMSVLRQMGIKAQQLRDPATKQRAISWIMDSYGHGDPRPTSAIHERPNVTEWIRGRDPDDLFD